MDIEQLNKEQQEFIHLLKHGCMTIEANIRGVLEEAETIDEFTQNAINEMDDLEGEVKGTREEIQKLFLPTEEQQKMLTDEKIQEYIANNGATCPYCGSSNMSYGPINCEDIPNIFQSVTCVTCEKSWYDIFKLAGIHEEE